MGRGFNPRPSQQHPLPRMNSKQTEAALVRLVEEGFAQVGQLPPHRFSLLVSGIEATGVPPTHLKVFATLFFLKGGEPFCCGVPGCYSTMFWASDDRLGEFLRSPLHLQHEVTVEIQTSTVYYEGLRFTAFGNRGGYVECPCCDYRTLEGSRESGQICEVCLWEDLDRAHPDAPGARPGHNLGVPLNEARTNFRQIGACHESYRSSVRPPSDEERDERSHGKPAAT
jgi:hypothetical protein